MQTLHGCVLGAVALLLAACGGGGGGATVAVSSGQSSAAQIGSAGVYDVNYGYDQFSGVYTLLENGEFYGMHFITTLLVGHPYGVLKLQPTINAPEPIIWANFVDDAKKLGTFEQDPVFGRSFSASSLVVGLSSPMGDFHAVANRQKAYAEGSTKTLYGDPLPLSTLAGGYSGYMRTAGFAHALDQVRTFAIDATGHVASSAAGCDFNGTMRQHGSTGIFDVTMQTSGTGCGYVGALKGIVTPLGVIDGIPKLGFQIHSADNWHAAVFIVTKS
jgi:hypothetical protein